MRLTIEFDDSDYSTIQREIAFRQRDRRPVPEGDSDTLGAMLAEIVRDLWEYRRWSAGEGVDMERDNGPDRTEFTGEDQS